MWDESAERFGRINVWINNAGIYQPDNRFLEIGAGTILYGTLKQRIRYFTDSLARETAGVPVIAGSLSPGMVLTDLLLDRYIEKNC